MRHVRGDRFGARAIGRFAALFRRVRRDESGATVVEFALVAPVFLAMLFAIFEVGLLFFRQMLLDNALQTASRTILTGETQRSVSGGNEAAIEDAFRAAVCQNSFFYRSDCSVIKVQVLAGDAEIDGNRDPRAPIDDSTNPPTVTIDGAHTFTSLPNASEDVVVRVYAPTQTLLARLNGIGLTMRNGSTVLVSSTAFRVEPFN
jgi:Flp pilus assembly protein TadG